ncbi:hypothetical protein CPB86DRAFT_782027 [Serendipita vermifera]|nr:hypothetical protein CPB86DRAFT_782027 [Serendipita vermifera]
MLEQLPNEIIQEILDYLKLDYPRKKGSPFDRSIGSVSLCSRRLRQIALPPLYHTITIFTMEQIDGLLLTMLKHPDYSPFVKRLTIHEDHERKTRSRHHEELLAAGLRKMTELLAERVSFKGWSIDARGYFLISLLPNLEELSVCPAKNSALSVYFPHLTLLMDKQLLSPQLRVWERGDERLGDDWFNIAGLISVLLYPSMKVIKAYGVFSQLLFHRLDKRWARVPLSYGLSNVNTIELFGSEIRIDDLADILRLCHALKRFVYKNGKLRPTSRGTASREDVAHALESAAQTLESLHLECGTKGAHSDPTVCSLNKFATLKAVSINLDMLGPRFILAVNSSSVRPTDILPPSLESLFVCPDDPIWGDVEYFTFVKSLLSGITSTRLARLREITCPQSSKSLPNWLIDLARERDVTIRVTSPRPLVIPLEIDIEF